VATSTILDHQNLAVDAFRDRVRDRLTNVGDDILEVSFDRWGGADDVAQL
jgi:hypothetical protein